MRHFISVQIAMATIAVAICAFITSCSSDSNKFSVDAHFLNMNIASFYVYSPDGVIQGIDTIQVQGGRFTYERPITQPGTIVIVFPNYTTVPVFVEPGADISIEANAANMKEMEVTGNDDNEAFTEWRKNTSSLSPKELTKHAEQYINEHPESPISQWLLRQYFILAPSPDYNKATAMLKKMLVATDNNINVTKMISELSTINMLNIGDPLPRFTATDINGKPVTNGELMHGNTVVVAWSTFNFESQNLLRQISSRQSAPRDGDLKIDHVVTICLEPDVKHCRRSLKDCNALSFITICDTALFYSPVMKAFGFTNIPDDALFKDGKLKARRVPLDNLYK